MKKIILIEDGIETEYTDFVLVAQEQSGETITTIAQSSDLTTFYANGYLNALANSRLNKHMDNYKEESNG